MATTASSGTAIVTTPSDTQILITREFAAPRHLVWRAWTEPELIERWWAGQRGTVDSAEVELGVGGTWRYVMTADGGHEVAFHGTFREIVPQQRLVNTEVFEGMPGDGVLVETTFAEQDGHTTLTQLITAPSQQVRDAILASGMESGMQESMDALEQVVVSLPA
ncbi:MAG: SRPBCC family protein [Jatrophihabitantaceae bacterium]